MPTVTFVTDSMCSGFLQEDSASKVSMKANMKADEMAAQLSARRKGVDLCFLLDCTGSMVR